MSKEYKTGVLSYNYDNNRYGILDSMDLWADNGLHCGEGFQILVNDEWKSDRIEMTWDKVWYLADSGLKGDELEGLKVRY